MMRVVRLLVFVAALPLFAQSSGTLYTIEHMGGAIAVSSVDLTTGATTPIVVTDAPTVTTGVSAFDPIGQRFFFLATNELYIVNLGARTFTHVPSPNLSMLEFSPATGQLYGIGFIGGAITVVSIDPATGAQTPRVITDAPSLQSGVSTFDPLGQRFFFRTGAFLYSANVATGTFSRVTAEGSAIHFDPTTGLIYAVDFGVGGFAVYSIDPATGATTHLVTTSAHSLSGPFSAFDVAGRRLFFRTPTHIYIVNVNTLTVTSVAANGGILEFGVASSGIPTLSQWMLVLLVAGLALIGAMVLLPLR